MDAPIVQQVAADDELELRRDLAAVFRVCGRNGWNENLGNHLSVALPGRDDLFLVNRRGVHFREVTASNLIVCDLDGRTVRGEGSIRPVAFHIHARIHRRHPAARAVLHVHSPYATALTCIDAFRFDLIHNNNLVINNRIVWDDEQNGPVDGVAEGDRLADLLGDRTMLMMAGHGPITVGPNLANAFYELCLLERTCMYTTIAMQTGRKLRQYDAAQLRDHRVPIDRFVDAQAHLAAWRRMLDDEEPAYRS